MAVIAHLTTVHRRHDIRILIKECCSLATIEFVEVHLIVADDKPDEVYDGVSIHSIGNLKISRIKRALLGSWLMFNSVRKLKPSVAHFHDSELIGVGWLLKLLGIEVIYDVHEDLPRQILTKYWIPTILRQPISLLMSLVEWFAGKNLNYIVSATPRIAERFPSGKTVVVQNFPLLSEFVLPNATLYAERPPAFAYVGGITAIRGVREMVAALDLAGQRQSLTLELAGSFSPSRLEEEVRVMPGWERVNFLNWASRPEVARLLGNVRAGLLLFHPVPNHIEAQPNKMFEYMAAGLPVIASDFPLWRNIINAVGCGILVDPMNPEEIAEAMCWILEHPTEAAEMGERGRKAVESKYNWTTESKKLIELYKQILNRV